MSLLTTLARLHAARRGRAEPLSRIRHFHLVDEPLVIVPLNLAGEAAAPLAAMVGTHRRDARLLIVPQPQNRDLRFAFFAALARIVLTYIDDRRAQTETVETGQGRERREIYRDAPQVIVPNRVSLDYLRLLGRSTRFRRTDGPHPVDPSVPRLGMWLTFLAERAEYPGSAMLLALTDLLSMHWATGQSALEDANLAALLGWIDPPPGMTGAQAALLAEDPLQYPPAGPATDPGFDAEILAPAIEKYDDAVASGNAAAVERAEAALRAELETQVKPTWRLMWQGIGLLRALPGGEAAAVPARWREDRVQFTDFSAYVAEGGRPQPRRDTAVAAARRLNAMERAQQTYDAERALDDPFVMAELRTTGDAFAGTVVSRDETRTETAASGRALLRPRFTVRTRDPVRIEVGTTLVRPERRKDKVRILRITRADAADDTAGGEAGADREEGGDIGDDGGAGPRPRGSAARGAPGTAGPGGSAEPAGTAATVGTVGTAGTVTAVGAVTAMGAVAPDAPGAADWLVELQVTSGMGTRARPCAEAVPQLGETVVYTRDPGWSSRPEFPPIELTPWTHGGPPQAAAADLEEEDDEVEGVTT